MYLLNKIIEFYVYECLPLCIIFLCMDLLLALMFACLVPVEAVEPLELELGWCEPSGR